jgi:hypothetical protein
VRALLRVLAVLGAAALCGTANATEQILSFDVQIHVLEGGTLEVTETIAVSVEGKQIKRGIFRDFPVAYNEDGGRVALASLEVLEVLRNGAAENYHRSSEGAYARIRIGQANTFLPTPSEQVYEIRYRTKGQLRAHGSFDELYWNVTGDRWDFPILAASVVIRLPDGTDILQHAAYTGPRGATGTGYEVLTAENGAYHARITAPLGRREGFTVAVGWPPGVIDIPPVEYGVHGMGGQYMVPMTLGGFRLGPIAAVAGTLTGALTLLIGWLRVGRDPAGGAIYPQFDPPGGLSPAVIRYVKHYGFDPRCLTAAILSMAVKGSLWISERPSESLFHDKEYTLEPLGTKNRELSMGEYAAYRQLFPSNQPLTLTANELRVKAVGRALWRLLPAQHRLYCRWHCCRGDPFHNADLHYRAREHACGDAMGPAGAGIRPADLRDRVHAIRIRRSEAGRTSEYRETGEGLFGPVFCRSIRRCLDFCIQRWKYPRPC